MCTNFTNFYDFHKLLSQFTKNNTSEISQNSQFSKISTQKKNQIFKNSSEKKEELKQKTKRFSGENQKFALHKKWRILLRISSVNVTKSAGNCGFGHIYWGNP